MQLRISGNFIVHQSLYFSYLCVCTYVSSMWALPYMEWCLLALSDELFVTVHASSTLEGAH